MQSTSRDHSNTRESIPPFTAPKSGYLSLPPLPSSSISRPSSKRSVFPVPSHETLPSLPRNLRPPISVRQLVLLRLEHGKEGQQPRNSPIDHAGRVTVWINHSITSLNVDQPRAQFVRNLGDGGDLSPWDETQRVRWTWKISDQLPIFEISPQRFYSSDPASEISLYKFGWKDSVFWWTAQRKPATWSSICLASFRVYMYLKEV